MNLKVQRRLAAQILKCGFDRVIFNKDKIDLIKESITKADIKSLIKNGVIIARKKKGISRGHAKYVAHQQKLGRRRGIGSRKGKKTARLNQKETWINKIRKQRMYIHSLRDNNLVATGAYRELYMKSKGGFFRSLRHLKLYVKEKGLINNEKR